MGRDKKRVCGGGGGLGSHLAETIFQTPCLSLVWIHWAACCVLACCGLTTHSVSATCPWGENDKITPKISATPAVDFYWLHLHTCMHLCPHIDIHWSHPRGTSAHIIKHIASPPLYMWEICSNMPDLLVFAQCRKSAVRDVGVHTLHAGKLSCAAELLLKSSITSVGWARLTH